MIIFVRSRRKGQRGSRPRPERHKITDLKEILGRLSGYSLKSHRAKSKNLSLLPDK